MSGRPLNEWLHLSNSSKETRAVKICTSTSLFTCLSDTGDGIDLRVWNETNIYDDIRASMLYSLQHYWSFENIILSITFASLTYIERAAASRSRLFSPTFPYTQPFLCQHAEASQLTGTFGPHNQISAREADRCNLTRRASFCIESLVHRIFISCLPSIYDFESFRVPAFTSCRFLEVNATARGSSPLATKASSGFSYDVRAI